MGQADVLMATSVPPRDAAPPPPPPLARVSCPSDQESLRLCLRFEDSVSDESQHGRDLDVEDVAFETGAPGAGRAARLGPDSTIRVPDNDGLDLQSVTVEAWIKLDRLPSSGARFGIVDKEARYGMFVLSNGALACSARGATAMASGAIAPGQWVSIACVASTSEVSVWVAGTRRAGAAAAPTPAPALSGLAIGGNMPSGDPLIGAVDNLRIWSRALGDSEICASALDCDH